MMFVVSDCQLSTHPARDRPIHSARVRGYEVELLEHHDSPGGLATSWKRGDYTFETCLHWLLGSNPDGTLHSQWQDVCDIVDREVFASR
jgi:phytoene dehydrogenase-like protein